MTTPREPALPPIRLPGGRRVPHHAVTERATTSGGPGGQHVNKTATRVELRIQLDELPLSVGEHDRLRARLSSRVTRTGELVVASSSSRSQLHNRKAARERVEALLAEALQQKPPRVPTRISRAALDRIRQRKQRVSQRKRDRRWRPGDDG